MNEVGVAVRDLHGPEHDQQLASCDPCEKEIFQAGDDGFLVEACPSRAATVASRETQSLESLSHQVDADGIAKIGRCDPV